MTGVHTCALPISSADNVVYSGSKIASGYGSMLVFAVGLRSQQGKIVRLVQGRGGGLGDSGSEYIRSVLPFSKLNKIFFGYFDPENNILDNKNK